jgi:putative Mg2+ transporter-C (MgtC) family protein
MGSFWQDVFTDTGNSAQIVRVLVRLTIAMILGGLLGFERQFEHKFAGIRTHMLVALGAALFTLVPVETRMNTADVSRVIQGIAAGIGFLGAGTILKLSDAHEIRGLTSAASIWLTAATGVAIGAGLLWAAIVSVVFGWLILFVLGRLEHHFVNKNQTGA